MSRQVADHITLEANEKEGVGKVRWNGRKKGSKKTDRYFVSSKSILPSLNLKYCKASSW